MSARPNSAPWPRRSTRWARRGSAVTPVFITVDPQRDTPAALADYVSRFHPRMQGLTGTPEQVAEVARRYRVYYARAQRPDMTDYLMDHSSFIYLVGPDAPRALAVPAGACGRRTSPRRSLPRSACASGRVRPTRATPELAALWVRFNLCAITRLARR